MREFSAWLGQQVCMGVSICNMMILYNKARDDRRGECKLFLAFARRQFGYRRVELKSLAERLESDIALERAWAKYNCDHARAKTSDSDMRVAILCLECVGSNDVDEAFTWWQMLISYKAGKLVMRTLQRCKAAASFVKCLRTLHHRAFPKQTIEQWVVP